MDPNTTLAQLRDLTARILDTHPDDYDPDEVAALAQRADSLDAWLSRGGFLPDDWSNR